MKCSDCEANHVCDAHNPNGEWKHNDGVKACTSLGGACYARRGYLCTSDHKCMATFVEEIIDAEEANNALRITSMLRGNTRKRPTIQEIGKGDAPMSSEMIKHVSFFDDKNRVSVSAHTLPEECPVLIAVSSGDADVNIHLSLDSTRKLITSLEEIVAVLDAAQEVH